MRVLVLFSLLWLLPGRIAAQEPSAELLQSCLLGTPENVWAGLKLSQDQQVRVRYIQEACKEECVAAGVEVHQDERLFTTEGTTVISELQAVLNADQYRAWVAYCAGTIPGPK